MLSGDSLRLVLMHSEVERIRAKFEAMSKVLDERQLRLWVAAEAQAIGWGGVAIVMEATGIGSKRIAAGKRELAELRVSAPGEPPGAQRIRRPGGGRKRLEHHHPELAAALEALIDPVTRGDSQSPLRWTCKSLRELSTELDVQGHAASRTKVAEMLAELGYRLRGNRNAPEGGQHPDRNAQFEHINRRVRAFHAGQQPVVCVDAKRTEPPGDLENRARDKDLRGSPIPARVHDVIDDNDLGTVIPNGAHELFPGRAWVRTGIDDHTAELAVETIRRWWNRMGVGAFPNAKELLVTADGGGSNGPRVRLWKTELQRFADETGLCVNVCHYPLGMSKWNKVEHRMLCQITRHWHDRPLESVETVVSLISGSTTGAGSRTKAAADKRHHKMSVVEDEDLAVVPIRSRRFLAHWNYQITPNRTP